MERYDLIVVGAGPSGLSAAIEAAKSGMKVIVFDENEKPGGQLFKQIHKFFGSKEHKAKIRGFKIGEDLLRDADAAGVEVSLNSVVIGLYPNREVTVKKNDEVLHYKGDSVLIATGAAENMVVFDGWTLPGVIGAGAAQTMMNINRVKPGNKILMLGTGNVGLVVSYQLLQVGCEVVALVDAAPRVGGYGVHASKVTRTGVPFYLNHTIVKASGDGKVEKVVIAQVDSSFKVIEGTEKEFEVDTICLAVGLSPMSQLCKMAGCQMTMSPTGHVPVCDEIGRTSVDGIFAAGDVSGIEEASSAMIEGRIAGISIASSLGFITREDAKTQVENQEKALESLRKGMFAPENRGKIPVSTDEGIDISMSLLKNGYVAEDEIVKFPGVTQKSGIHPVIECTQNIPCNPCRDACPKGCIKVDGDITALPAINTESDCIGCGLCVAACSGQAIFLLEEKDDGAYITMPYEFLPLPKTGDKGTALDRSGKFVCECEVVSIKSSPAYDKTHLLTVRVPQEMAMKARQYKA